MNFVFIIINLFYLFISEEIKYFYGLNFWRLLNCIRMFVSLFNSNSFAVHIFLGFFSSVFNNILSGKNSSGKIDGFFDNWRHYCPTKCLPDEYFSPTNIFPRRKFSPSIYYTYAQMWRFRTPPRVHLYTQGPSKIALRYLISEGRARVLCTYDLWIYSGLTLINGLFLCWMVFVFYKTTRMR